MNYLKMGKCKLYLLKNLIGMHLMDRYQSKKKYEKILMHPHAQVLQLHSHMHVLKLEMMCREFNYIKYEEKLVIL